MFYTENCAVHQDVRCLVTVFFYISHYRNVVAYFTYLFAEKF